MIAFIVGIYGLSALYFFISRHKVQFMTRSPVTVAISIVTLGIDSILNTLIFSENQVGNMFHWQCDLGITATLIGQFGFELATAIRIYRVQQVYSAY